LLPLTTHAEGLADHVQRIDPPKKLPPLVFEDAHGAQHALADYRGKFVLLNVWATWCAPCVGEMPSLDALQDAISPDRLAVIPLSEDRGDSTVTAFYRIHKIAVLPVAIDHAGIAPSTLQLRGLPTTLLIDPQGREIARIEGDEKWDSPDARAFLKAQMR
jgi:thiol-disulfide isomerase/thioredoxin